jgi:hypothetical protein
MLLPLTGIFPCKLTPLPKVPEVDIIKEIQEWYHSSEDALVDAKRELKKTSPTPAEINWKVSLYQLIVAYIVNFRIDTPSQVGKMEDVTKQIIPSQPLIDKLSEIFALKYVPFVDLAKVPLNPEPPFRSGPFCGVFISEGDNPFMILSFKGTTYEIEAGTNLYMFPSNQDDGTLYNKFVHGGMYDGLFSKKFPGMNNQSAFDVIWEELEKEAKKLNGSATNRIPLYVSGHSLGAGYAQLAYVELFRRVSEAKQPLAFNLKALYAFAAPRVGTWLSGDAVGFATYAKEILKEQNKPIFRYANERDVIPFIPGVVEFNHVPSWTWLHLDEGYILHRDREPYWTPDTSEIPNGLPKQEPEPGFSSWDYHFPGEYYNSIKKILDSNFDAEFPPRALEYQDCP